MLEPAAGGEWAVRTLRPDAVSVAIVDQDGSRYNANLLHGGGIYEARLPQQPGDYRVEVTYSDGSRRTASIVDDPVPLDGHGRIDFLIGEGRHEQLWNVLGAHVHQLRTHGRHRSSGTSFAVWAPNAQGVRLVGDFNYWDGRAHPMRALGVVRRLGAVRPRRRRRHPLQVRDPRRRRRSGGEKADPMAFAHRGAARRPRRSSFDVAPTSGATTSGWRAARPTRPAHARR